LRSFDKAQIYPHTTNGLGVMITASWAAAAGNQFSEQIEIYGQIWTLRLLPMENWKGHEYNDPREFYKLSNEG
jgi:hypothetical protein